jgi:hypothetical protein
MMSNRPLKKIVNPPRPKSARLDNGYEIFLADGLSCAECGVAVSVHDTWPIGHHCEFKLLCRNGHLVAAYAIY